LWDLKGRRNSSPVSGLLAGNNISRSKRVPRYASLSRYSDNGEVQKAVGNLVDAGYQAIKIHQAPVDTLDAVKKIRETVGRDFELMVDLNCGFTFEKALDFMKKVERYDLKWIEEPVWPPDDFESLKK